MQLGWKWLIAGLIALGPAPHVSAAAPEARALNAALDRVVYGKATGTVLVSRRGKVFLARSFSDATQTGPEPSRWTTYDLASIAKTITAVLALRLVDQGQFDMDAPLRRYLPELPVEMIDITARNAMSHTAGLPRYLEGDDLVRRPRE